MAMTLDVCIFKHFQRLNAVSNLINMQEKFSKKYQKKCLPKSTSFNSSLSGKRGVKASNTVFWAKNELA